MVTSRHIMSSRQEGLELVLLDLMRGGEKKHQIKSQDCKTVSVHTSFSALHKSLYIPRTQMTLVLIGKDLVLEG